MRNLELILNNLCLHSNDSDYKFERLYRILFNEGIFHVAYQRIYAKPGNMTPGTDGQTIDQMNIQRIERLIESLRNESYKPNPARRVYIPKKNGKRRPLGIPSFEDKLVQESVRLILEAIYEGHFEDTSHGFRPRRSCASALLSLQKTFTGTKWFIEGDIKGFFDNIDHNVLINILAKRISDERFLRLIRKFLNAGYVEEWTFHNTYSGTPQGGIISPILANIYLDEFDKYMKKYAENFNKGKRRRENKEYRHYVYRAGLLRKKIAEAECDAERQTLMAEYPDVYVKMRNTPCTEDIDENYRRINYVRYADDFLIGVIGTKAESEQIKADITQFMSERLKLELSAEKTLITNAHDKAKFLGFEIYVRKYENSKRNSNGIKKRCNQTLITLALPKEAWQKKLAEYEAVQIYNINGKDVKKPSARGRLVKKNPEVILAQYNSEIRGLYNYYCIANNVALSAGKFAYFMEYSLYKTLALKYRSSVGKIKDKYHKGKDFVIPYKTKKGQDKVIVLYHDGFKRKTENLFFDPKHEELPEILHDIPSTSLVDRLMEKRCELCGAEGVDVVMHHVRRLSLLKGGKPWENLMLKRRRKTLVVCTKCNALIQKSK